MSSVYLIPLTSGTAPLRFGSLSPLSSIQRTTMPTPPSLALLRRHGKSFYWASALLPAEQRLRVAELYLFCRRLDDIADTLPIDQARQRLYQILQQLENEEEEGDPEVARFLRLEQRFGVPHEPALDFVSTLLEDCQPFAFARHDQLLRYAYGVAGTVGLLLCPLLGVNEQEQEQAAPYAANLGIAMQLTNIARDVLEDAQRGRCYLPHPEGIAASDLLEDRGDARQRAWEEILRLLKLADDYYQQAEAGYPWLPPRSRLAVAVAARIYAAIGEQIRNAGVEHYWQTRAFVPAHRKLLYSAQVIIQEMLRMRE